MTCLGGTREAPRNWVRVLAAGEPERHDGRICDRTHPLTSRTYCAPCPAYRGLRRDGSRSTGLYPDGTPYGLSADSFERYEAALVAMLDDDEVLPFAVWEARELEGIGAHTLRELGDPDATEAWAAHLRAYRQRHPDHRRRADRPDRTNAERQRRWRERHRTVTPDSPPAPD
jgi:hypothetical protein